MSSICVIILATSLFGVYIYKMYSIAKTSKDEDLLNIIARNSLLAGTISIATFSFILFAFTHTFNSSHYNLIVDIFFITDIYTNALCIFLSYKILMFIIIKFVGIVNQNVSENVYQIQIVI